jgi:hypothetical protein
VDGGGRVEVCEEDTRAGFCEFSRWRGCGGHVGGRAPFAATRGSRARDVRPRSAGPLARRSGVYRCRPCCPPRATPRRSSRSPRRCRLRSPRRRHSRLDRARGSTMRPSPPARPSRGSGPRGGPPSGRPPGRRRRRPCPIRRCRSLWLGGGSDSERRQPEAENQSRFDACLVLRLNISLFSFVG